MNTVTIEHFGSFVEESLEVDFIAFNAADRGEEHRMVLARFLRNLGFNVFLKKTPKSVSRIQLCVSQGNYYEVYIILKVPYKNNIVQIQFPGKNGKQFYDVVKQRGVTLQSWKKFNAILTRVDLVYVRKDLDDDFISVKKFFNESFSQFQDVHKRRNIKLESNLRGLNFKIGHRKGPRHYRVYREREGVGVRFEAEMKGEWVKDLDTLFWKQGGGSGVGIDLLREKLEFERRLSYMFFKYSYELFHPSLATSHTDWLICRLRPFNVEWSETRKKNQTLRLHYLSISKEGEKQHFIYFLKLLNFLDSLEFSTGELSSKYRKYYFRVKDR